MKAKDADDGKEATTHQHSILENGDPSAGVDEAATRQGANHYTNHHQQSDEYLVAAKDSTR